MELKNYLVVKGLDDEFEVWTKKQYDTYISGCFEFGAGSAFRVVTHFDGSENLLNDKPAPADWIPFKEGLPLPGYDEQVEWWSVDGLCYVGMLDKDGDLPDKNYYTHWRKIIPPVN